MKKLYSQKKYRLRSILINKKQGKRLRNAKCRFYDSHYFDIPKRKTKSLAESKHSRIVVPNVFSLTENPLETINFLNRMRGLFATKPGVFVDMSDSQKITADAVTTLVSYLKDNRITKNKPYIGNNPNDPVLKMQFAESGFYRYVRSNEYGYAEKGNIIARNKVKVDGPAALKLIEFATQKLYGEYIKQGGVFNVLSELMNNTRDHADKKTKRRMKEQWWASAHYDNKNGRVVFTFIDNGVGIFNSRGKPALEKVLSILRIRNNTDLLKKMLKRELPSSTKMPYRGRGIPSIYDNLKRGQISNLIIISNNVYAHVDNNDFKIIAPPLNGTFFSWEIKKDE